MTAIITPQFRVFYNISKEDRFFVDSRWVYNFETCFGYKFDSYFLAFGAENIKKIDEIVDDLEMHKVKRIYE